MEMSAKCNSVWLHPFRPEPTMRICELTEEQLSNLLYFLTAESPGDGELLPSPLPILVNRKNRSRVDPQIALPEYHIYRDRWERKILFKDIEDYELLEGRTCTMDADDYPELEGAEEFFSNPANTAHAQVVEVPDPRMRALLDQALPDPEPPV